MLPCSRARQKWIRHQQTHVCWFVMLRGIGFLSTTIRTVVKHKMVCEVGFHLCPCPTSWSQFSCSCHCTWPVPLLPLPSLNTKQIKTTQIREIERSSSSSSSFSIIFLASFLVQWRFLWHLVGALRHVTCSRANGMQSELEMRVSCFFESVLLGFDLGLDMITLTNRLTLVTFLLAAWVNIFN